LEAVIEMGVNDCYVQSGGQISGKWMVDATKKLSFQKMKYGFSWCFFEFHCNTPRTQNKEQSWMTVAVRPMSVDKC